MHRAYLVRAHGPPSSHAVESIPTPAPEGNEVLVSVKAAGVNFPDSLIIRGKYQFQPQFPYSPGGEFSGVVDAVGPDVSAFASGDRVVGMSIHGSYSEKLITDESKLASLPQSMDFATGAVVQLAHGTMLYALKDVAKLERGETLLVLGAGGGVGLASVELGKLMGARVVAVASSTEKLNAAKALGADVCLDYSKCSDGKALKALLKEAAGSGFDVAVDPVGDFYSEPAIRSMGWGGRYLVIGFAAGSIPKVPLNLPLLKNCSLMGVFWGAWAAKEPEANLANFELLAQWHNEGKLRPLISERFSLDDAAKAIETLDSRRAKGKLIVVPGPPDAKL